MISPGAILSWLSILAVFAIVIEGTRRLALALGAVARPNPIVSSHRAPVPYLGGSALMLTWLAILAVSWRIGGAAPGRDSIVRVACALALAAFGTWDDLRAFGPKVKFAVQFVVCATYLVFAGPPQPLPGLFQLFVLVTLINAFNLIDVMDGLLCVVTAIAAIGLLATPGLVPVATRPELQILLAGLGVLFLFNRPSARIYNGDAGSMTLGFLVGSWILGPPRDAPPLSVLWLVGLVVIPTLELLLLIPARIGRGTSPFRGSPDHFALRLQDQRGWSKWRVLAATAAIGVVFALVPYLALQLEPRAAALLALLGVLCAAALWRALWRIPPSLEALRRASPAQAKRAASK